MFHFLGFFKKNSQGISRQCLVFCTVAGIGLTAPALASPHDQEADPNFDPPSKNYPSPTSLGGEQGSSVPPSDQEEQEATVFIINENQKRHFADPMLPPPDDFFSPLSSSRSSESIDSPLKKEPFPNSYTLWGAQFLNPVFCSSPLSSDSEPNRLSLPEKTSPSSSSSPYPPSSSSEKRSSSPTSLSSEDSGSADLSYTGKSSCTLI